MLERRIRDRGTIASFASFMSASSLISAEENEDAGANWEDFLKADAILSKDKESEGILYGIERYLYELNSDLVCLSPLLIHAAVLTPAEALLTLESVAMQPNRPPFPIDQHLAAFLISRWKGVSFSDLWDVSRPQWDVKSIAALKILADIQKNFNVAPLPNLCQWMAEVCAPTMARRPVLKGQLPVEKELAAAVAGGRLASLVRIFDHRGVLPEEEGDFPLRKIEVLLIESEIKEIKSKILNRNQVDHKNSQGILGKLQRILFAVMNGRTLRQGKIRLAHLDQRAKIYRERADLGSD